MRRFFIITAIATLLFLGLFFALAQSEPSSKISWQLNDTLTRTIVWDIAVSGEAIYAGTDNGLYQSPNKGTTWRFIGQRPEKIRDIYLKPSGEIFVATWGAGLRRATGEPATWSQVFFPPDDANLHPLFLGALYTRKIATGGPDRETVYVGTYSGVHKVVNGEGGLTLHPTGLSVDSPDDCAAQAQIPSPDSSPSIIIPLHDLVVHPTDPQHLYAAIKNFGVCESIDAGETWKKLGNGPEGEVFDARVLAISQENPSIIYLGTFGQGVYRSESGGQTWAAFNNGDLPADADIWSLQFSPDGKLYAGTRYDGTLVLPPGGEWTDVTEFEPEALSLAIESGSETNFILAGTWGGGIFRQSTDGSEWQSLAMPALPLPVNNLIQQNEALFAGTDNDGVWRSLDSGKNWEPAAGKRPQDDEAIQSPTAEAAPNQKQYLESRALVVRSLLASNDNQTIYAGTGEGLYRSNDKGDTWHYLAGPTDLISLLSVAQEDREIILGGTQSHGLHLFFPDERRWQQEPGLSRSGYINALAYFKGHIYASQPGRGLRTATADFSKPELKWDFTELSSDYVQELVVITGNTLWQRLFHGSSDQLLAITERGLYGTHNGINWDHLTLGSFSSLAIDAWHPQVAYLSVFTTTYSVDIASNAAVGVSPQPVEASEEFATLLISPDNGWSWPPAQVLTQTRPLTTPIITMIADAQDSGRLYAAAQNGLYVGEVKLPPLWREILFYLGLISVGVVLLVLIGASYGLVAQPYQIALPRAAYLLSLKFDQLNLVWERLGLTRLSAIEQLVLLNAPAKTFHFSDIWKALDRLGAAPTSAQLQEALNNLTYRYKLLAKEDQAYRLKLGELQKIGAKTFGLRVEQTKKRVRRAHFIYRDVEQFFGLAGFEVHNLETEYLLRPETPDRIPWGDTWAWLHLSDPLTPDDVAELSDLIVQRQLSGPAFVIVSERPSPEGYLALARQNSSDRPRLVLIDAQRLRRALIERNAAATLDIMLRQAQPDYDHFALYTPVVDQMNFFGQEELVKDLHDSLKEGLTPVTTLSGLPKIGLTSLLEQLKSRLDSPCALIDLRYEQSPEVLRYTITSNLLDDLQRKYPSVSLTPLITQLKTAGPGDEVVGQVFQSLQAALKQDDPAQKFVILVDASGTAPARATALLQEIGELSQAQPQLLFVVAHNNFVPPDESETTGHKILRPLSKADTRDMIICLLAMMGRAAWPAEILDLLYDESGGHPWLLRQLGSALSKRGQTVEANDVAETVFELIETRSAYFEALWDSLPPAVQDGLQEEAAVKPAWLTEIGLWQEAHLQIGLWQKWIERELS